MSIKSIKYVRVKKIVSTLLILILLAGFVFPYYFGKANAVALTEASIRLDRMGEAIAANTTTAKILVVFKPTSTATEGKIVITWPTSSAFTVSSTDADHTSTTTNIPATYQGEALTGVVTLGTPGAETSGVVTYTTGDLTAGTLYGFYITGGITNPVSANAGTHLVTIATTTSGDVAIDSTQVAVDTLSSSTGDQVTVTATVPPTFNFAIADSSIALGTLSAGSVSTNAMSSGIDVDTNAQNGYVAFIRSSGSTATLDSAAASDAIGSTNTGSPDTCSAGSECYVVDAAVSGSGAPTTEYDGNGTTSGGVIPVQPTYDEMVTATAPVNNDAITLTAIVAISPVNKAATDYTDTWEVVGAGNF